MTDPAHQPEPGSNDVSAPGMPRWVKASLLVAAALVLILVILKLTGSGGEHGPGRHQASGPVISAEANTAQFAQGLNALL